VVNRYQYTLGAAGNRTRIVEHTGRTVDYSYDALYRLTREFITEPLGATTQVDYGYDAVGNRLSKTVDGLLTINYAYDANDRLLSEGSTTYSYDANGNTLSKNDGSLTSYVYDAENRLIRAQTATDTIDYTYDANGIRQSQTVNGNTTTYLVDQNRDYAQVLEERDAAGVLIVAYTYGDDLLSQHRGGTTRYYHYDGLGSTRALTDATEATTDTYTYDAFGNLIRSTGTTQNNYLYTGEQYDPNIGFYYLRARYMNPENGRFLTTDPIPGLAFDPVTLHKYLYARGNPANVIDPRGEFGIFFAVSRIFSLLYRGVQIAGGYVARSALSLAGSIRLFVALANFRTRVSILRATSTVLKDTKTLLQLQRSGGFAEANKLFDRLAWGLGKVTSPSSGVRAVKVKNYLSISVRSFSKGESRPTVQIDFVGRLSHLKNIKIRFP